MRWPQPGYAWPGRPGVTKAGGYAAARRTEGIQIDRGPGGRADAGAETLFGTFLHGPDARQRRPLLLPRRAGFSKRYERLSEGCSL